MWVFFAWSSTFAAVKCKKWFTYNVKTRKCVVVKKAPVKPVIKPVVKTAVNSWIVNTGIVNALNIYTWGASTNIGKETQTVSPSNPFNIIHNLRLNYVWDWPNIYLNDDLWNKYTVQIFNQLLLSNQIILNFEYWPNQQIQQLLKSENWVTLMIYDTWDNNILIWDIRVWTWVWDYKNSVWWKIYELDYNNQNILKQIQSSLNESIRSKIKYQDTFKMYSFFNYSFKDKVATFYWVFSWTDESTQYLKWTYVSTRKYNNDFKIDTFDYNIPEWLLKDIYKESKKESVNIINVYNVWYTWPSLEERINSWNNCVSSYRMKLALNWFSRSTAYNNPESICWAYPQ